MDYKDFETGIDENFFWFRAKRELLSTLFQKAFGTLKTSPRKILDVGAGTGEDIPSMRPWGEVYALDTEQAALDQIPAGIAKEKVCGDVCALPYPDNFFQAVVACDILEHIEDDTKAIAEIQRVLAPGGLFILTVPAFPALYGPHDLALGHYRRYAKKSLAGTLANFEKISRGFWACSTFPIVALKRLLVRKNTEPKNDTAPLPHFLNKILLYFFRFENFLIKKGVPMPFGTTIYAVYRKK